MIYFDILVWTIRLAAALVVFGILSLAWAAVAEMTKGERIAISVVSAPFAAVLFVVVGWLAFPTDAPMWSSVEKCEANELGLSYIPASDYEAKGVKIELTDGVPAEYLKCLHEQTMFSSR